MELEKMPMEKRARQVPDCEEVGVSLFSIPFKSYMFIVFYSAKF